LRSCVKNFQRTLHYVTNATLGKGETFSYHDETDTEVFVAAADQ